MKLNIYLDANGLGHIAQDRKPYNWNFIVRKEEPDTTPPTNALLVTTTEKFFLPSAKQAVPIAVAELKQREQNIYTEAEREARVLREQIQNLLALEGPTS